jgi:hypothetical protein
MSLDFAILKYLTTVNEACVQDVTNALKGEYDSFKNLKERSVIMTLMTAEAFGAVEKTRLQLDESGETKVYYRTHKENVVNINIQN